MERENVFLNPENVDDNREICDLLLVHEDKIICFSIKYSLLKKSTLYTQSGLFTEYNFPEKICEESIKQLKGAKRYILGNKEELIFNYFDSEKRKVSKIIKDIKEVYTVAINYSYMEPVYISPKHINNKDCDLVLFENDFGYLMNKISSKSKLINFFEKQNDKTKKLNPTSMIFGQNSSDFIAAELDGVFDKKYPKGSFVVFDIDGYRKKKKQKKKNSK